MFKGLTHNSPLFGGNLVDHSKPKTFKWSDLHRKTIEIYAAQDIESGMMCVMGYERATGMQYLISIGEENALR